MTVRMIIQNNNMMTFKAKNMSDSDNNNRIIEQSQQGLLANKSLMKRKKYSKKED